MTDTRFVFNDNRSRHDFLEYGTDLNADELFKGMEQELKRSDAEKGVASDLPEGWLMLAGHRTKMERRIWLVEEVIPAGEITLLASAGGFGKTSLVLNLAGAIHRGDASWGGKLIDPEAVPMTLLTTGEQSEPQLHELARLVGAGDCAGDEQWLHFNMVQMPVLAEDFWTAAAEARKQLPNSAFIVDSASSCFRVDSTAREDVTEAFTRMRNIGGTWIVLHHTNKDREAKGSDRITGSTAWVDRCDRLIMITGADAGALKLKCERRGPDTYFTVPLPHIEAKAAPGRPQHSERPQAEALLKQGHSVSDVVAELGLSERSVRRWKQELMG